MGVSFYHCYGCALLAGRGKVDIKRVPAEVVLVLRLSRPSRNQRKAMDYAWHGTLQHALELLAKTGAGFVRESSAGYPWSASLPLALDAIASHLGVPRDLHVVLEYRLPFNGQRIDLLLLGQNESSRVAHVVEL